MGKSQSQSPWWIAWKCHMRSPVSKSTATMLSANRLFPGRIPPYQSFDGVPVGR